MHLPPKCRGACIPAVEKPQNLQKNITYAAECKECGYHIIFRLPGSKGDSIDFLMLGDQKPLNLPQHIRASFLEFGEKYGHLMSIAKDKDFKNGTGFPREKTMATLYEMFADGDIDDDMFHKMSTLINKWHNK